MALPHHCAGGVGIHELAKKSFKLLSKIDRSLRQKSASLFGDFNPFNNSEKLEFENWNFGFRILASALTREPPLWWCSGETPPQGGQRSRCPDEKYEIAKHFTPSEMKV